ncbi:Alpha/Beta hydrolase protein [Apiosordaria backusii]|uniref:Carboxylic ester hydrolase n=1 Tax=Apiosordaria backusii TaxID=314023 RepID=A0AA40ASG5_9PEZI|nr:Alpha/Beta hydrolase protein [Apiosordaria backusii]
MTAVLATATASISCYSAIEKHGPVSTSSGLITGHIAPNTECVMEFLGIPYAKPPVGDLRFAPPQKAFTPDLSYNASAFGYDCPLTPSKPVNYPGFYPQAQRILNYFASAAGTPQSEDCLTLNIWTKPISNTTSDSTLKPVLIFFYGGRFTIGNTNTPFYNGANFASAQDIIIITVNYRLNIFGFPGSPTLPSQNLGLRDQRLAVEWVRDNIPRFGGDPSKITLFGQSSGGVSVDYWAYAYPTDPIAHGLVAHSGTAFSFPSNTNPVQESNWNTVVSAVNCSSPTPPSTVLSCMRTLPWQTLLSAASAIKPAKSTSPLRSIPPFYPTPDNVTVFSPSSYLSLTRSGQFAPIPVLLGNTDNEAGYYRIPAFAQNITSPTPSQIISSFLLESFTCPVLHQASARTRQNIPAYVYRYFADWENTRLYPTSGAYHGVDLHMVFGGSEEVSGLSASKDQRVLTGLMQRAWWAFADDPENGLGRWVGWPRFEIGEGKTKRVAVVVEIGRGNRPGVEVVEVEGYERGCEGVTMGALGVVAV